MPDGSPGLYVEYYDSDKETTRIRADPQLTGDDGVTREVTIDKTFVEPIGYWSSCIAAEEFPPIDDEPEPDPTPTLAPGATPTPTDDSGFFDPEPTDGDDPTPTPDENASLCERASVQFRAYDSTGDTVANGTQDCRDDLPGKDPTWNVTDPTPTTPTNGSNAVGGGGGGPLVGDDAGSGASPLLIGVPAIGAIGLALYRRYQGGGGTGGAGAP